MMMKPLVESPECSYHCPALSSSSSERQNLINRLRQELLQLRSSFHKDFLHLPPLLLQCETVLKRMSRVISLIILLLKLNIPDYLSIIKHPMDLGTVALPLPTSLLMSVLLSPTPWLITLRPILFIWCLIVFWSQVENYWQEQVFPRNLIISTCWQQTAWPLTWQRSGFLDRLIINFLRDHISNAGGSGDDEIEIDINGLSHDALFQLRDLLDEFLQETQSKYSNGGEPCDELELLHGPGSSLTQHYDGSEMED